MASRSAPLVHVEPDAVCNLLPRPGKYTCFVKTLTEEPPHISEESATMRSGYEDDEQHIIEPSEPSVSAGMDEGWRCTVLIDDNGCVDIIDDERGNIPHTANVGCTDAKQGLAECIENLAHKRRRDLGTHQGQPVHLAIDFM